MSADTTTEVHHTAAQTADNSARQSLWMILAAFAFSAMGVCVKLASAHYSTGEIVFYRSIIGVVLMGAILQRSGQGVRTPYFLSHIKRSVFGVTSLLLWFTSISLLPLATAMGSTPRFRRTTATTADRGRTRCVRRMNWRSFSRETATGSSCLPCSVATISATLSVGAPANW